MGYVTMAISLITIVSMAFGLLLGFMRGFNRSVLRLLLVVASVLLAVALRSTVTEFVMNLDLGGETLAQTLAAAFNDGSLPASLQNLIFVLVEVIIGIVAFFVVFVALGFISWIIVFPILKIFVRKGIKRRRLLGAIVGLVQGFVVAFAFCAPLTGIIVQVDKISKIELDGKPVIEVSQEMGIAEYVGSTPCVFYETTGGWFFDMISTGETEDGKNVSIDDAVSIVSVVGGIANTMTEVQDSVDVMIKEGATLQERMDAMKNLGDSLINIDTSIDGLSDDAKEIVNDIISSVKEMITPEGEELDPAIEEAFDNFDVSTINLAAAGEAMKGIATYIEKTSEEFENNNPVTQENVDMIVNGIADSDIVFSMITEGEEVPTIVEINDAEHKTLFENSISNTDLSDENKDRLRDLFGLNG